MNVAVIDCALLLMLKLQGEFVPVHGVGDPVHDAEFQPKKVDPALALAEKLPTALLSDVVSWVQVAEIVTYEVSRPLPVQADSGVQVRVPEVTLTVTNPEPLPPNVTDRDLAAITYGPTNGPPLPSGGAPAGLTGSLLVSLNARAKLRRPLPV